MPGPTTTKELEKIVMECNITYSPHELQYNLNTKKDSVTHLKVYRGDNRTYNEIRAVGFQPRKQLPQQNLLNLAAHFVNDKSFRDSFCAWWKYRNGFTLPQNNIPFVATGTTETHYGDNEYEINIDRFNMFNLSNSALKVQKIGFNGITLENSSIIAFQIYKDEIIFATTIPPEYIKQIK